MHELKDQLAKIKKGLLRDTAVEILFEFVMFAMCCGVAAAVVYLVAMIEKGTQIGTVDVIGITLLCIIGGLAIGVTLMRCIFTIVKYFKHKSQLIKMEKKCNIEIERYAKMLTTCTGNYERALRMTDRIIGAYHIAWSMERILSWLLKYRPIKVNSYETYSYRPDLLRITRMTSVFKSVVKVLLEGYTYGLTNPKVFLEAVQRSTIDEVINLGIDLDPKSPETRDFDLIKEEISKMISTGWIDYEFVGPDVIENNYNSINKALTFISDMSYACAMALIFNYSQIRNKLKFNTRNQVKKEIERNERKEEGSKDSSEKK